MAEHQITDWIGREETAQGRVGETMSRMMAATLSDTGVTAPSPGDVLPPLWHWTGFPPTTPMAELGRDGHPKLGGFLPPVGLPRRMWAGGDVTFVKPIHVGERLTRHSVIDDIVTKKGKAGPMVFVTVLHDIAGEDGLALREQHDIVYLELPRRYSPPAPMAPPETVIAEREVPMSETLLFRFSACTFNAHRIDRFRYRGVHPMFPDAPLRVLATGERDGALDLCTARGTEHQGMTATAQWEETT